MRRLKYLGMIFFDSGDRSALQNAYLVLLIGAATCSVVLLPFVAGEFDDWSEVLSVSFAAIVVTTNAGATVVYGLVEFHNTKRACQKYKVTLEGFEIYVPTGRAALNRIKRRFYTYVVVCLTVTLPANIVKLWNIYSHHEKPVLMTAFFLSYYVHNFRSCCSELHFAFQCILLRSKFQHINGELKTIADQNTGRGGEANSPRGHRGPSVEGGDRSSCAIVYERDFYRPKHIGYSTTNTLELLRIKHWLTREAVHDVNSIFGVTMGLSLITLITSTLFDVYDEVFYSNTAPGHLYRYVFRSKPLLLLWMIQHFLRLCLIIVSAHAATKQAAKTKMIVTEINNRHLDPTSKEELQIFHDQLCAYSIKFTIFDSLTVNNRLFTSLFAIIVTYTMVLVQFHSNKKHH